jgi:hypothetical protein
MLRVRFPKVLHLPFDVFSLAFCADTGITDLGFGLTEFFGTKKLVNIVWIVEPLASRRLLCFNFTFILPVSERGCRNPISFLNSSERYVYCCFWHVVVVLLISVLLVQKLVILFLFICIGSLSIDNCSLTINSFYTRNVEKIETI